jgi:large subunit ribosomal protein L9
MIEVILMERVESLGQLGQVVKVKPGYARNFLLPQKKALRATKANTAYFEQQRAVFEAQNIKQRDDAAALAKTIEGLSVMLVRQASESGQLFGSVTARDVAEAATEAGNAIERRLVEITTPIKSIGLFPVKIKLHPEVTVTVTVNVARTEEEGKMQQQRATAAATAATKAAAAADAFQLPDELVAEAAATDDATDAPKPSRKKSDVGS